MNEDFAILGVDSTEPHYNLGIKKPHDNKSWGKGLLILSNFFLCIFNHAGNFFLPNSDFNIQLRQFVLLPLQPNIKIVFLDINIRKVFYVVA